MRTERRLCVMLLLIAVVMVTAAQILKNDPECLAIGGLCTTTHSCPVDSRANKTGLCTQEREDGICCHGVPANVSCGQKGGQCVEECKNVQNFGQVDCKEGTTCCLLIT